MNQIERIRSRLAEEFPDLPIEIEAPGTETGPWLLIVERSDLDPVTIEWRPRQGFGLATPGPDDFGMGVDEIYATADVATKRAIELIRTRSNTVSPVLSDLALLRSSRGLTQTQISERSGITQASLSRIENGGDVLLSTLSTLVSAMGATLVTKAVFKDGTEREIALGKKNGVMAGQGRVGLDRRGIGD